MEKSDQLPELISIIIPNLNSPIIGEVINAIKKEANHHPFEIIVVGKDKWNILDQFSEEIIFIDTEHPVGAGRARNIGIQHSKGNWLFFTDADCFPQQNWMMGFIRRLREGWEVVGGGVVSDEEKSWRLIYNIGMFHEFFSSKETNIKKYLPTLNLAVKREVINEVGFLNEALQRCEDLEWTLRMTQSGYRLLFEPAAAILHKPTDLSFKRLKNVFYSDGFHSIQNRKKFKGLYKMPAILGFSFVWKFLSPLISALTTLRIFISTQELRHNPLTIPYVYILKIIWCFGAAEGLKAMDN